MKKYLSANPVCTILCWFFHEKEYFFWDFEVTYKFWIFSEFSFLNFPKIGTGSSSLIMKCSKNLNWRSVVNSNSAYDRF